MRLRQGRDGKPDEETHRKHKGNQTAGLLHAMASSGGQNEYK
jgi:hypothetical protein